MASQEINLFISWTHPVSDERVWEGHLQQVGVCAIGEGNLRDSYSTSFRFLQTEHVFCQGHVLQNHVRQERTHREPKLS